MTTESTTGGVQGSTESAADAAEQPAAAQTTGSAPAAPLAAQEVPESYADFAMPEGVALDAQAAGDLKSLAKELGLSQANAQRVADLGAQVLQRTSQAQADLVAKARNEWAEQARADKEMGGDKLAHSQAAAKRATDKFGSPELVQMLDESGLGNHPEVLRLLARVGAALTEDVPVSGAANAAATPSARDLYPNSTMNP